MMRQSVYLILGIVFLIWPADLRAHRTDADYRRQGDQFQIEFFFSDGLPAVNLDVTATSDQGHTISLGPTNNEGIVMFQPPAAATWTIVGKGGGHGNTRDPLIIPAETVAALMNETAGDADASPKPEGTPAEPSSASPLSSPVSPPDRDSLEPGQRNRRGAFPWLELMGGLLFILILTIVTLLLMRRSAVTSASSHELSHLVREVNELQATVDSLRRELDELRQHETS